MSNIHVMLDLETWSISNTATIVSIGAVKFDPDGHGPIDRFHVGIDPSLSKFRADQFDIDPSTMLWWLAEERAEARKAWLDLAKMDLGTALEGFAMWFEADKNVPVWGNGATFDNVILRHAFKTLGMDNPWGFRSDRCYRTLKNLAPNRKIEDVNVGFLSGVQHDALYDATVQALHLQDIVEYMGLNLK